MKVKQLSSHRNGISGIPFHVGIVDNDGVEMLVVRFPAECDRETGGVLCAAFSLPQLDKREIRFMYNSFRGDHFHTAMDKAIKAHEKKMDRERERARG